MQMPCVVLQVDRMPCLAVPLVGRHWEVARDGRDYFVYIETPRPNILYFTVINAWETAVTQLLDMGAHEVEKPTTGSTALHLAVSQKYLSITRLSLNRSCSAANG